MSTPLTTVPEAALEILPSSLDKVNIDQSHFGQLSTYGRGAAEGLLDRPCMNGLKRLPAEVGIENVSN